MAYRSGFLLASSYNLIQPISINLYVATWPWSYQSAGILFLLRWQAGIS